MLNIIRYLRVLDIPLSEIGEFLKNRDVGNYQHTFLVLDEEDCYEGQTEELPETRCVTIRFCGSHREAGVYYKKLLDYIRCEMTPTSVGGEQQISISGGSQSPI